MLSKARLISFLLCCFPLSNKPIGEPIGSVQLDTAFEESAKKRLHLANRTMPLGWQPRQLHSIAWRMAKEREFQNAKCGYGSWDNQTEYFTVAVPGLRPSYQNMDAEISNGEMRFRRYGILISLSSSAPCNLTSQ